MLLLYICQRTNRLCGLLCRDSNLHIFHYYFYCFPTPANYSHISFHSLLRTYSSPNVIILVEWAAHRSSTQVTHGHSLKPKCLYSGGVGCIYKLHRGHSSPTVMTLVEWAAHRTLLRIHILLGFCTFFF